MHSFFIGVAVMFPAKLPVNIATASTSRSLFEDMRHSPMRGMLGPGLRGSVEQLKIGSQARISSARHNTLLMAVVCDWCCSRDQVNQGASSESYERSRGLLRTCFTPCQ